MAEPDTGAELRDEPKEPEPPRPAALSWLLRIVPAAIALGLGATAVVVLHRELSTHSFGELRHALRELPPAQVLHAALLTALSYVVLTGYDALALTALKIRLPYARTALASFLGYVFSNNIGLSVLGSGAARWRVYRGFGLTTLDVAKVVAFCAATFWLGLLACSGAVLAGAPELVAAALHLPLLTARIVGILCLATAVGYVVLCARRRAPLKLRRFELELPTAGVAATQVAVSMADWTVAAAVLYALLPVDAGLSFPRFLGVFLAAQLVAVASHVPGGLGVFEWLVLSLLKQSEPSPAILGALLAYRALYYLAPLALGTVVFALLELFRRATAVDRVTTFVKRFAPAIVPRALAISTFWAGAILLLSGATPTVAVRSRWIAAAVPLGVVELSHFYASIAGVALLVLARGLHHRLRFAWGATALLLFTGAAASLLKGLDWEEAAFLVVLLLAHLPCRRHFTRHSSLRNAPFTPGWIAAVVAVLGSAAWLALFSHRHVEYSSELWWRFAIDNDAPRALRALTGAAVLSFAFALARLLRPAQPVPTPADAVTIARAEPLIARASDSIANLALVGDKALLFDRDATADEIRDAEATSKPGKGKAQDRAFLMFAVERRSWIALGDPVGETEASDELAWRFHELVHRHGGRTVFYQVLSERLPLYLELGLKLLKLGEEARVDLHGFKLSGGSRRKLRRSCEKVEEAGGTFELVPAAGVAPLLPELARVSDAWLAARSAREKGFSLGFFDAAYLVRRPVALVRHGGRIVAFANVWAVPEEKAGREELSIDLMRHLDEAPDGTMDFLLTRLMEWGRDQGYRWFSLGMAPLSGLETRPLAPLWNRFAAVLFHHGESLYNFQGVRRWKDKFDPVWRPRWLAYPGSYALPAVLRDVTALVSGGVRGIFRK